jgi:RNA polymerase sigma factor (sigma-70 family)
MKQALIRAIDSELTDRQKQMVTEYYFDGSSVTEIAKNHQLSKSTVSRHLSRSRERLKGALKYGMYSLWSDEI